MKLDLIICRILASSTPSIITMERIKIDSSIVKLVGSIVMITILFFYMRIYLDNCCYNRPFDTALSDAVIFEANAKINIQKSIIDKKIELAYSFVLLEEILNNPYKHKKDSITSFLKYASVYLGSEKKDDVLEIAKPIMESGIKYMDAAHIASAILAKCSYFISTDKRLLKYQSDKIQIINPVGFIFLLEDKNV